MAKKLSKKQRQRQKAKQQNKLLRQGYSTKDLQRISNADLQKLSTTNIPQSKAGTIDNALKIVDRREKDRQRKAKQRQELYKQRQEKYNLLEKIIGADVTDFEKQPTAKFLDSLKLEDLQAGKYKRTDFKEYIPKEKLRPIDTFDFEKIYPIPDGKKLHFAFRSLSGDRDISHELEIFSRYSNEDLISNLRAIKEMPQTRTKGQKGSKGRRIGSSGQAGESMIKLNNQKSLNEVYQQEYNADRRSNNFDKLRSKVAKKKGIKYQHSGIDYHWQHIRQKDENGKLKAYTEISARKLLIIGNALMWNITESDRAGFYNDFYTICCEIIPEMKHILP